MNLYVTADTPSRDHGGGSVTYNELDALCSLGEFCVPVTGTDIPAGLDPFGQDRWVSDRVAGRVIPENYYGRLGLAHCYAGCFSETIEVLQYMGVKVTYTAAAHSIEESRREHELLGFAYDYPHLTDPGLWAKYLAGYLRADALVVPSEHSRKVMCSFGASPGRVVLIPHGVTLPVSTSPLPKRFTVGYLGACAAPDKGLIYLLEAWGKLNYPDALLKIGGADSTSRYVRQLVSQHSKGNVQLCGWVENVSDFYNSLSCYVQPSVSEGFGLEILEAMAHRRNVISSRNCAGPDLLDAAWCFDARDVGRLARLIGECEKLGDGGAAWGEVNRGVAERHTWDEIKKRYVELWKGMLK